MLFHFRKSKTFRVCDNVVLPADKMENATEQLLRKANNLLSTSQLKTYKPFLTLDELRIAAFTDFFVKVYVALFDDRGVNGIIPNPSSKREFSQNLTLVLSRLDIDRSIREQNDITCKAIMDGNIESISYLVDLFTHMLEPCADGEENRVTLGYLTISKVSSSISSISDPSVVVGTTKTQQKQPFARNGTWFENSISEDSKSVEQADQLLVSQFDNLRDISVDSRLMQSTYSVIGQNSLETPSSGDFVDSSLKFSYVWLEFLDPRTQSKYEHFLAIETNFWTSLIAFVIPMWSLWLFYMCGEIVNVMKRGSYINFSLMLFAGIVFMASSAVYLQSIRLDQR